MTDSTARAYLTTIIAVSAVGFIIFLIAAGIGGWLTWSMWNRSQTWTPVVATVEKIDLLCDVEKKNGKTWDFQQAVICEEAATIVAEHDTAFEDWRYVEAEYATISYEAAGQPQRLTLRSSLVSTERIFVGDTATMMVNPANPTEVERPFSDHDINVFWTMIAFGSGAWVLTTVIGVVVAKANRRVHLKRQPPPFTMESQWGKAQAAPSANPAPLAGAAPLAAPDHPPQPAWRRVTRWIGWITLIVATLFALLAVLGSKGDRDALLGAAIFFVFGLIVWGVLRLIAGPAGPRPAPVQPATPKWGRS